MEGEELARAICETCAQLHQPNAPLHDIAAANLRLIQLCEHEQAPQACLLIVRHGAQLAAQGAPIHACALAAGKVERACRERIIGGDDAFALLEQLATDEAGDACAGAVCAAVAFWCVESGQEVNALDRCAARPVLLATAIADELARRGMMGDAAGAWRAVARAAPPVPKLARCVQAWAACGARLRGAPPAVLGGLLEAAIGGDADATGAGLCVAFGCLPRRPRAAYAIDAFVHSGALCALVEAEPPLPPADAVAPYHTLVALAVAPTDAAAAADARASLAAALLTLLAAPVAAQMERGSPVGAGLLEGLVRGVGATPPNVASTCTDAAVAFLDALPDRSAFAPPWRRPLASAVVRAAAARASDAFYASGQSFEDRDDATFNRLYHAGPCLYQLALALDETDVTEGELLASAPWLEEAMEAVLGEEEEEEDSE